MGKNSVLEVPRALRRGGRLEEVERSVSDSTKIYHLVCKRLGLTDLNGVSVLDMGCGWRMSKAILDNDLPVAHYAGIDVFAESIEFLSSNVSDERFSYYLLDSHNEMYNPGGKPLADFTELPVHEASFDLVWLFSVFTHLAPHDYAVMLKLLRPYVKPQGKLVFSVFLNEETAGGHGFIDNVNRAFSKALAKSRDVQDKFAENYTAGVPEFVDFDPENPLKWAIYRRDYAMELIEGTGWTVDAVYDPEEVIQHYIVCSPC